MQRLALLSDIHANLVALEAVLRDVEAQRPDLVVVLGDTINYGPRPRECLSLVDEVADVVLAGNHEKEAARGASVSRAMETRARAGRSTTATRFSFAAWSTRTRRRRTRFARCRCRSTRDDISLTG